MGEGSDHTEMSLQALEQLRVGQIPAEEPTCGETSVEQLLVRVELTLLEVLMLSFKYWLVKSHTFTVPSDTVCSSALQHPRWHHCGHCGRFLPHWAAPPPSSPRCALARSCHFGILFWNCIISHLNSSDHSEYCNSEIKGRQVQIFSLYWLEAWEISITAPTFGKSQILGLLLGTEVFLKVQKPLNASYSMYPQLIFDSISFGWGVDCVF